MAEKEIMTIRNEDRINFNLAQDQLIDFALTILNEETKITEENLTEILPAFFSYCSHIHESEGTVIDQIHYTTYRNENSSVAASSVQNFININTFHFERSTPFRLAAEFLTAMFHETQHVSDIYNTSKQDKTITSTQKNCYGTIDTYFNHYLNHYKMANFFKISNPLVLSQNQEQMHKFSYKNYFFSELEVNARARGFSSSYQLLEYAKTRPDILSDEKKFNQINGLLDEVSLLNRRDTRTSQLIIDDEISPELRQEYLDHMELFYQETKEIIEQSINNPNEPITFDNETTKMYEKNNLGLETCTSNLDERLEYLTFSQYMFYDEERANEISELILLASENGMVQDHKIFSYLTSSSDFSPTPEQMDRIAKVYQYANPEDDYPLKNSLSDFISSFNTYSQSFLLPIYAKNNPDFLTQVANYESELYPLDMEVVSQIELDSTMDTPTA